MRALLIKIVLVGFVLVSAAVLVNCGSDVSRQEPGSSKVTAPAVAAPSAGPRTPAMPSAGRTTRPASTAIRTETPSGALRGLVYADGAGVHIVTDGSSRTLIGWSTADVNSAIALSPDGTRLAYSHTGKDLWLLDLVSGGSTVVISPSVRTEHAYILQMHWSPDGDWLALLVGVFHVDGRPAVELDTLFTMEINTGRVVELESGVNDFVWLSSGRQIAYNKLAGTGKDGLYVIQADGGGRRLLPFFTMETIAASPREDLLAVVGRAESKRRIFSLYVLKLDGSAEDILRDYPGPADLEMVDDPSWSPDGTRIAFTSCEPLASNPQVCGSALFVIDVKTRKVDELAADARPPLAWSPDGRSVAVTRGRSICRVSLDGEVTEWFDVSHLHSRPFEWR